MEKKKEGKLFRMGYFERIYKQYHQSSKWLKQEILNRFCKMCKYNRKYAIRKLNGPPPQDKIYSQQVAKSKRKRATTYGHDAISIIAKVWQAADFPCSKRLRVILSLWLSWIIKHFHPSPQIKEQILKISARQLDRRLQPHRAREKHRIYGRTKPGTLLKHQIPIKTDHWDVKKPGFTEVDTVSHSGNSASGLFAFSVNQTDILTQWVETCAVLGKAEKEVNAAMGEMEKDFPFKILGVDSDNGGEFINHHLKKRCEQQGIQFTRSRAYKKDDNAHIEQKNWTHVRRIMGWHRYDTQAAVNAMNDLYRNELRLFMNLFMPSMKQIKKGRVGSKPKRKHDKPMTPLDRLVASGKGDPVKVAYFKKLREQNDPFALSSAIEKKVRSIYNKANHRYSPKATSATSKTKKKRKTKLSLREEKAMEEVSKLFGIKIKGAK